MKIFTPQETRAALSYTALVDGLRKAFQLGLQAPLRHHHTLERSDESDQVLLLMPAWSDAWGGVKIVTVTPGNSRRGLPAVAASYLLFDRETGAHKALLDGGELTARRTAAASALAADSLARQDAETLLIVGAGRVAAELPAAYAAVRSLRRVLVWNRNAAKAEQLAGRLRDEGFTAERCTDLPAGVAEADIISCATLSYEPVVQGDWLQPGQHLDLIGAFTPQMREVDDTALRRARIFVDTDAAITEAGELAIPLAAGVIQRADIIASLYELVRGQAGRESDDEITLFKSVGVAIEDLAAAQVAMAFRS